MRVAKLFCRRLEFCHPKGTNKIPFIIERYFQSCVLWHALPLYRSVIAKLFIASFLPGFFWWPGKLIHPRCWAHQEETLTICSRAWFSCRQTEFLFGGSCIWSRSSDVHRRPRSRKEGGGSCTSSASSQWFFAPRHGTALRLSATFLLLCLFPVPEWVKTNTCAN